MNWFASQRQFEPVRRVRSGLRLAPNEERYVLDAVLSSEVYGNPSIVRIRGPLDVPLLKECIRESCQRHETRRSGYEHAGGGRFTKYVEEHARFGWVELSIPGASEEQITDTVHDWYFRRVDLTPLMLTRFLLIKVGAGDYAFAYSLHHATSDGETKDRFLAEVLARYSGEEDFPPSPSYSELWSADWTESEAYRTAEAFWNDQLRDVGPIGTLARDRVGAGELVTEPATLTLAPELVSRAKGAASQAGVSDFTFFYAVSLVQLARLTGEERVATTFQSAGRRSVPGAEGVHGVFSNGLVLATAIDETESIAALAGRLRGDIRNALVHEQIPYHHVIRNTGVSPQFGINWFPEQPQMKAAGLEISQPDMAYGRYEYDLSFRFVRQPGGSIDLIIFFKGSDYGRDRVDAIARQFAALLDAFAGDCEAPIGSVRSHVLAPPGVLPDPAEPLASGGDELIHDRFLERAREAPDAVAIAMGETTRTYGELARAADGLAARLARAGVLPGDRVAILAERGPELVAAMLGVARAGGVFVVLDAAYPEARLKALLEISAPAAIVTAGRGELSGLARRLASGRTSRLLDARTAWAEPETAEAKTLVRASAADPAYILFTSGSTGRPKGVACSHAPLTHFIRWQAETFGLGAGDRFTMLSGLSHDPLLRDVFTPLSVGAAIVIPDAATIAEPESLAPWLKKVRATVAHMTPPMGELLLAGASKARSLPDLRRIFWGGDLLAPRLVDEVARLAPAARQVNFYGSTETPQAASWFACEGELPWKNAPVGKGTQDFQLLVVDRDRRPAGVGEVGEIAVRSNYLSLGYVEAGRILDPDGRGLDADGRRNIYYTGDRGFYLPGGDVMLLGRADDQVKVRGYRVELAEIAEALKAHPAVRQAAALAVGEGAALKVFAFVVGRRRGAPPTEAELLTFLAERLPDYMLPRAVRVLESLPLLPNGKVDRKALEAQAAIEPPQRQETDPGRASAVERALIERWGAVLAEAQISRNSSFAALGGDSLSYVQAYLATEEVIGEVPTGWHLKSIAELAAGRTRASGFWSTIDTPMLVRAISIVLVVAGHMHFLRYGGGATAGLMLVSGFLFGSFQIPEVFARNSAGPILKGLRRLLVPTLLFSVFLFAAKSLVGKTPDLSVLFLYGNFQDYSRLAGPRYGGHEFYLWFIYCMIQMMALLYLAVLALKRLGGLGLGRMGFALIMFLVGCLGRFVAPSLLIPGFFSRGAQPLTMVNYLPSTHLPTLMLGALVALAETRREKMLTLGALVAYSAASAHFYGPRQALVILAAGVLIMAARRLPLPRPLTVVALTLSGASLFIYLTHFVFSSALRYAGAPAWPALHVAVGLAGGVAVWSAWVRASSLLARLFRQPVVADETPAAI